MQLAHVLGTATATVKHASLAGAKLLVVQPLMADRTKADGDPQLAIDTVSAGVGDLVMITSDGRLLRDILKSDATPARYSVVALVDDVTDFSARKQGPSR
jgi:ethanolamine utilization protein EutN